MPPQVKWLRVHTLILILAALSTPVCLAKSPATKHLEFQAGFQTARGIVNIHDLTPRRLKIRVAFVVADTTDVQAFVPEKMSSTPQDTQPLYRDFQPDGRFIVARLFRYLATRRSKIIVAPPAVQEETTPVQFASAFYEADLLQTTEISLQLLPTLNSNGTIALRVTAPLLIRKISPNKKPLPVGPSLYQIDQVLGTIHTVANGEPIIIDSGRLDAEREILVFAMPTLSPGALNNRRAGFTQQNKGATQ